MDVTYAYNQQELSKQFIETRSHLRKRKEQIGKTGGKTQIWLNAAKFFLRSWRLYILCQQRFNTQFTSSRHCTLPCTTCPLQSHTTFGLCRIFRRIACFFNPHCTVLLYYYHRVSTQLQLTTISIKISNKSSFHLSSTDLYFFFVWA
jgi:hypothetical protein